MIRTIFRLFIGHTLVIYDLTNNLLFVPLRCHDWSLPLTWLVFILRCSERKQN